MVAGGEGDDTDHSEESEDDEQAPLPSIASPTALKRNVSFDSEGGQKRLKLNNEVEESQVNGTSQIVRSPLLPI